MPAATQPTDGAVTLPSEVTENAPSTEVLIAAFAANCHHHVTLSFEDMNGTHPDAGECDARMFEQNCSPDNFGCCEGVEKCRDACADPCHTCQSVCADRCDSCKTRCSGASGCLTACAKSRVDCRVQCLGKVEASERDQDVKRCAAKFPHNAAECLDWCTPGE